MISSRGEAYLVLSEQGRSPELDLGMASSDGLNSKATTERREMGPHHSSEMSNPETVHDSGEVVVVVAQRLAFESSEKECTIPCIMWTNMLLCRLS